VKTVKGRWLDQGRTDEMVQPTGRTDLTVAEAVEFFIKTDTAGRTTAEKYKVLFHGG
jgi:hypothetical protein